MKAFRFSLESVLETRRVQEQSARQELALAIEKHRLAVERSREAMLALNQLLESIASESAVRFSVANRERSWSMRQAQERLCGQLRAAAQECSRHVEVKRAAAVEAKRNCELLEQLKLRHLETWRKEAAHAEQLQLDEFAMTRRHQVSKQNALC
jgi:flagellar export protein FliJ